MVEFIPLHFIGEPVEVHFNKPPALEKKPGPPDRFTWRGSSYIVVKVYSEWADFQRKGRMARNMRPEHAAVAERRGSRGVGLFYFRVQTDQGRYFDLYYDRSPKNVDQTKGSWFLFQELSPIEKEG